MKEIIEVILLALALAQSAPQQQPQHKSPEPFEQLVITDPKTNCQYLLVATENGLEIFSGGPDRDLCKLRVYVR